MRSFYLIHLTLIISCNSESSITETQEKEFKNISQSYQRTYMEGSANCEEILAGMDEEIKMWENGKLWTYSDLKKFCPHLPKKNVVKTYNDQRLLNQNLGYDFVSQLYICQSGDTIRETVSRI